ncbi:MAG TPA: RHS repeat domain-containing protein, partial [Rhodanobacteraceae bacterium]
MSGGHFIPNQGDPKPASAATAAKNAAIETNCNRAGSSDPTDSTTEGDPVVLATGNEIMPETDFHSTGQMGLSLTRTYDYYWNGIGIFGRRWLSNYDYKLLFTTHDPTSSCYTRPGNTPCDPTGKPIWALRPDGRLIKYNYSTTPVPGWYEDKPSPIAKILKTGTTYTLYGADHTVETYDSHGFPVTINNRQGQGWTFAYDANDYLTRVTSSSGRYVEFGWNNGVLTTVTDPAGNVYHYSYTTIPVSTDSVATQSLSPMLRKGGPVDDPPPLPPNPIQSMVALLTSVTQPGTQGGAPATQITYHYEDSRFITALTGKSINGHRYSWITYNAQAMVSETHLANSIEDYQFAYVLDSNGHITQTTVTNPLGRKTTYHFDA